MSDSGSKTASILEEFAFLGDLGTLEMHQPGSVLMREGEAGDCMYIVKTGFVEVTRMGQLLALLEPGAVLGEMALIDMKPRSATAITTADCELIRITRDQFIQLARENLKFFTFMMEVQAERLRRMNDAYALRVGAEPQAAAKMSKPAPKPRQPAKPAPQRSGLASERKW